MKLKLVVFIGLGICAKSGINTFPNSDGLSREYDIMEVVTPPVSGIAKGICI